MVWEGRYNFTGKFKNRGRPSHFVSVVTRNADIQELICTLKYPSREIRKVPLEEINQSVSLFLFSLYAVAVIREWLKCFRQVRCIWCPNGHIQGYGRMRCVCSKSVTCGRWSMVQIYLSARYLFCRVVPASSFISVLLQSICAQTNQMLCEGVL